MAQPVTETGRRGRRLPAVVDSAAPADAELLRRFARSGEEQAFGLLLRRHGPLILGLCRRLVPDRDDADDLFQATFFLLARKARSIRKRHSVGSWLYGVAFRLAGKMRAQTARRRLRETRSEPKPAPGPPDQAAWREICLRLDEELARLPHKYRAPLLLCYWEGQSQSEAADQLGWPRGTLKRRLERAREILRQRLGRQGLAFSAALLVMLAARSGARAAVPAGLVRRTLQAGIETAHAVSPPADLVAKIGNVVRQVLSFRAPTAPGLGVVLGAGSVAFLGAALTWLRLAPGVFLSADAVPGGSSQVVAPADEASHYFRPSRPLPDGPLAGGGARAPRLPAVPGETLDPSAVREAQAPAERAPAGVRARCAV